jgi:transposase
MDRTGVDQDGLAKAQSLDAPQDFYRAINIVGCVPPRGGTQPNTQSLQQCPGCQGARLYRHGAQPQTYRDAPSHGKPVRIQILRRRYRCLDCKQTAFDPIPDLDGKRRATTRLVAFVRARSLSQTFAAVAREAALDEKTVRQIFADHVAQLSQQVRFEAAQELAQDIAGARAAQAEG